ncbi:hypothetical protein AAFC00_007226 [Neodothiora populina]|uniref:Probable cytosolic iron-sulfur protein assembly protein 1 n=1 Tax=Neodothiora populina TaxID=2781224 RepID=A0ABR3PHJ8_9PEZI
MAPPSTISAIATLTPPSNTRTWLSSPHPNLPIVATACSDRSVRIYSLKTFNLLSTITGGHKRSIRSVAWKPGSGPSGPGNNGIGESVLATGSFDASAGIWRRDEGSGAAAGGGGGGGGGGGQTDDNDGPQEVDYTRQRQAGDDDDDDDDDDEWNFAVILDGHESEIKSLAFSSVSPLLATCSRDKSVWIWEELEDDNFETVAVLQEHEGDVKCVAWHPSEELLVSSSYDDNIRLWREDIDDWGCCACLEGHTGTVWWVEFEGADRPGSTKLASIDTTGSILGEEKSAYLETRQKAGPRLVSASDDLSIRIWRRIPSDRPAPPTGAGRIPSIIKSNSIEEQWVEEARLPQVHERAIYAVSWSKVTGRIVSSGSDGKIVVYEERWRATTPAQNAIDDTAMEVGTQQEPTPAESTLSEWVVVAEIEDAHDIFEVNHVCWAKRVDAGKQTEDEEMIVSTGDDGEVRLWALS